MNLDDLLPAARSPADYLRVVDDPRDWGYNAVLLLVARHAGADRPVLLAVLGRAAELLRAGARPYAAVLALAERPELRPEEIRPLGGLAGASRRMRRGLDRALAAHAPASS
ncbi:hypothetical protein ABT369_47665 [Dactylosporangium sp. NPDC000244]|uniref:hypothetical protein n=1 Tax=Dactylosporangium sp. NPDC000244 TaxID=3154365 RepID=UPI003330AC05